MQLVMSKWLLSINKETLPVQLVLDLMTHRYHFRCVGFDEETNPPPEDGWICPTCILERDGKAV